MFLNLLTNYDNDWSKNFINYLTILGLAFIYQLSRHVFWYRAVQTDKNQLGSG